jgi:hypothetical protein
MFVTPVYLEFVGGKVRSVGDKRRKLKDILLVSMIARLSRKLTILDKAT